MTDSRREAVSIDDASAAVDEARGVVLLALDYAEGRIQSDIALCNALSGAATLLDNAQQFLGRERVK
ncbi:MAG: hypothetical protein V4610_01685 [Pseudomonadota bacterium]|jgi:hypothetical protein